MLRDMKSKCCDIFYFYNMVLHPGQGVKPCHRRYCDKSMPASNAARSEKIMWIRKNRCECTKIVKVVENDHLRLETSENYKDCYCIFFGVPEHPSKEALPLWTPLQGPLPFDPTKCCDIWKVNAAAFLIFTVLHPVMHQFMWKNKNTQLIFDILYLNCIPTYMHWLWG